MGFKRFSSGNTDYYRSNYVGANGELTWDDSNGLRLHDGSASGGNPVLSVNPDGTITFPTTINAPVGLTKQSFGMGNLFAWQDGDTWTIATGDPSTGQFGLTGIGISPGIESNTAIYLPRDFTANVNPLAISNFDSMGNVVIGASTYNWKFSHDGNLVLPSGGQILNNDLTPYGTGSIGFVTDFIYDGNGITLENASLSPSLSATAAVVVPANGNTSDPLKLQNNIGSVSVVAGTDLGNLKTWSFSTNGGLTFPDSTVQTTAYRVMSLPPLTAWGTVVGYDSLSFSFDATTGSPGFNGGYGGGGGAYSTLIWTADIYQQQASTPNLTISSGGPVQYFNYNGPNLITEVALTPGDSFVLRIQDVDTNRVYRATFLASYNTADTGNEGKYGTITVERLV